jgi:hypothetical protein
VAIIHNVNEILGKLLGQNISQTRENIENECTIQRFYIQNNPNYTDYQKSIYLNNLEQERQRLLSIQDAREMCKEWLEYLNKIDENESKK